MLCNISQNAMGQVGGTLPGPAGGGTLPGPAGGAGGYPARSSRGGGGTLPGPAEGGGEPCQVQPGGYPAGGVPR